MAAGVSARATRPWAEVLLAAGVGLLLAAAPASKALIEVGFVLAFAGGAALLAQRRLRLPKFFLWLVALWLVVCLASALAGTAPALSLRAFWRKTLQYGVLALLAAHTGGDAGRTGRLVRVLAFAGAVVALDALVQGAIGQELLRGRRLHGERLTGPLSDPNSLASFLLLVIPAQAWAAWTSRRGPAKAGWLAGAAMSVVALMGADARGAWLVLWCVAAAALVWLRRVWLLVVVVAVALAGMWRWELLGLLDTGFRLDPGREEGWGIAWRMFLDHPLLGAGLGRFMALYGEYAPAVAVGWPRPQYAHNCYLQLLGETGALGLASFLAMAGCGFGIAAKVAWRDPAHPALAVAGALLAFLVNIGFDTGLYSVTMAAVFWVLLGLAAGTAAR